jgi:hypothetical protein
LISGARINTRFWLQAAGLEPILIERAAALRTGGYVTDFWGLGRRSDFAEIAPDCLSRHDPLIQVYATY